MQLGGGCDSTTGRNTLSLDVVRRHLIQNYCSSCSKKTAITRKSKSH